MGVWLSTDPKDQYWSPYSYVGGHPTVLVDPYGMNGVWAIGMLVGAAIGGTAGYIASDGDWRVTAASAIFGGAVGAGVGSAVDWALESMGKTIDYAVAMQAVKKVADPNFVGNLIIHSSQGINWLRPSTSAPNLIFPLNYGNHALLSLDYNLGSPRLGAGSNDPLKTFATWPQGLTKNNPDDFDYLGNSDQRSYPITKSDLVKISDIINKTQADQAGAWSPFSPCSDFAADSWYSITGEKLSHRHRLIPYSDPNVLSRSINKAIMNEYRALDNMAAKIR